VKIAIALFLLLFVCSVSEESHVVRRPASGEGEIIDKLRSACDSASPDTPSYSLCGPYKEAKQNIEKKGDALAKEVVDFITPEAAAVSGFLLKSLYEKRISLEVKTSIGKPAVSITNNTTIFSWSIEHNF